MTDSQKAELKLIEEPVPMEGWCTHEKACALFTLVETYKPDIIVDLGSFGGRSTVAFALACKSNKRGMVFGVDAWQSEASTEGTNDPKNDEYWRQIPWPRIVKGFYDAIQSFDVYRYVVQFARSDLYVADFFRQGTVDMIHFDINHSEEVACRSVRTWLPKIRKGGIIVMDDIDWDGQKKAEELMISLGCERMETNDKWGIYKKL